MNYSKAQQELNSGINLLECDKETIKYTQEPIGKAILRGRSKKPIEEKAKGNDKIKCQTCGKEYFRYNSAAHKKTKYHQIHEKVEQKMREYILKE